MAVKKTELYNKLWASCDKLRGGMDASQYKDYILTLLFMKYVTDKYKGKKYGDIKVFDKEHDPEPDPEKRTGCSFDDFVALKNNPNIGEGMDKIIARLTQVNDKLKNVIDNMHFNDENKIGKGKEMVDKLTGLVAIFQHPDLDFKNNKAEGDDIIGDAYEYLMRNFATESGKSKGQFYTPAEVSRILAQVIGIDKCTDHNAEICDPACGSGSLLIRALNEAPFEIAGYGQEKDTATAGLANMNAVLHNRATISIKAGNTFSDPQFKQPKDDSVLRRFDYVVANPPFSIKNWTDGLQEYGRFDGYGDRPPETNGDYAWLMHILKTLKNNGKAAVILPHGVLFRGNAEAIIRKTIIEKGWIKGVIGLPANLFYGTGIPACIIVIDKEGAENRSGIFMIDASRDFVKDGNKNRLRERDIYKIVHTFNHQIESDPKYARFVPNLEIKQKNDYNLNISRYIDASEPEDVQNIQAHIKGGIPAADIDSMNHYWDILPALKNKLFSDAGTGFYQLDISKEGIRDAIYMDMEFIRYGEKVREAFDAWKAFADERLDALNEEIKAKKLITALAEKIMELYQPLSLLDKYDVYQVLMAYWNDTMSDDVSLIISDEKGYGVARETENITSEITSGKNKGKLKVIGWEGKLIPKEIMIDAFFDQEKEEIAKGENERTKGQSCLNELIENSAEDSILTAISENGKVNRREVEYQIDEIRKYIHTDEIIALETMLSKFPMNKNQYTAYVAEEPLCYHAYTENKTITKASISKRIKTVRSQAEPPKQFEEDYEELVRALELICEMEQQTELIKELKEELDHKCRQRYEHLTDEEIKELLMERKWYHAIDEGVWQLYSGLSNRLATRITQIAERYEDTLPKLMEDVETCEAKVKSHLERMGFEW